MVKWNRFSYKLLEGLDQFDGQLSHGPAEPGSMENVENLLSTKRGKLQKRNGIRRVGNVSATLNGAKRIDSGNGELVVLDDHKLYAYNPTTDTLAEKGLVGPGKLSVRAYNSVDDNQVVGCMTLCEDSNGTVYQVIVSTEGSGTTGNKTITVRDLEGGTVLSREVLNSETGNGAATCICSTEDSSTNGRYAIIAINTSSGMTFYRWDSDSPTTSPTSIGTQSVASAFNFDLIGADGGFWYCYVNGSNEAVLVAKDESFSSPYATSSRTYTTRTTYTNLSLGWDAVNSTIIFVKCYNSAGSNYGMDMSTHSMSNTLPESVTDTSILAPGGSFPSGLVALAPNLMSAVTGGDVYVIAIGDGDCPEEYVTYNVTAGTADSVHKEINGKCHAKPFSYNGRYYAACSSIQADEYSLSGIHYLQDLNIGESSVTYDVNEETEATQSFPCTVAAWQPLVSVDNGSAVTYLAYRGMPVANGDTLYWSCSSYTDKLPYWRMNTFVVSLDMTYRPEALLSVRNGVFVTGSIQCWYDGNFTQELGCLDTPSTPLAKNGTGTPGPDIFTVQNYYTFVDGLGLQHRGYPSEIESIEVSDYSSVDGTAGYIGSTMRNGTKDKMFWNGFSTGPGTSRLKRFTSLNPSATRIFNIPFLHDVNMSGVNISVGAATSPEPYTIDGRDLANVPFGGCEYAVMTTERLWVANLPLGSEIQYSDQIVPTATNNQPFAPEFNPQLRVINPDATPFTGMGVLQDKVLVFSEEAVFGIEGRGPGPSGANDDGTGLVVLSNEFGCINGESVVECPAGVMFQTKQGFGLVQQNTAVTFLGNVNTDLESYTIVDSCHFPDIRACLFLADNGSDTIVLGFDYVNKLWYRWTTTVRMKSLCVHDRTLYFLSNSGNIYKYDTSTYADQNDSAEDRFYTATVRTPYFNLDNSDSGWLSIRWAAFHGARESNEFQLNVKFYYDDDETKTVNVPWTDINAKNSAGFLNFKVDSPRKRCKMFSMEISDASSSGVVTGNWGLQSIDFEVGARRGTYKTGARV